MKFTIAAIVAVDAAILAWAWRSMRADFGMVVFALACITFFGSVPVVLGAISRRRRARRPPRGPGG